MKRKLSRICSFSIQEDCNILERLHKLADQEGESLSHMIVTAITEYVKKHEPGNPQRPLGLFSAPTLMTCFKCKEKFPNTTLTHALFISGETGHICPKCKKYCDERRLIKKVLK